MNMARQCWDEARHVQIYEKLLDYVGGAPGMFPRARSCSSVRARTIPRCASRA
jgi:hypothetical protein